MKVIVRKTIAPEIQDGVKPKYGKSCSERTHRFDSKSVGNILDNSLPRNILDYSLPRQLKFVFIRYLKKSDWIINTVCVGG